MAPSQVLWYRYAVKGGVLGGIAFLLVWMLFLPMFYETTTWMPLHVISALILDNYVLSPPAEFEIGVIGTGLIVHFALSILFAMPFAMLANKMNAPIRLIGAMAYSLLLYLINFYLLTSMFTWFADYRNWITIAAHLSYGTILALSYSNKSYDEKKND